MEQDQQTILDHEDEEDDDMGNPLLKIMIKNQTPLPE